jgi:hypothetical protein
MSVPTDTHVTQTLGWYANTLADQLSAYFDAHHGHESQVPATIRLDEYPGELIEQVLANETAHPLLTMAHTDRHGYPFITVMGFVLIDGKIHIASRKNAAKIKRLQENPRCSMVYQNNVPRPEKLGSVTLVGRATISRDPEKVRLANEILSYKVYRDGDPDADRRQPMIDSMNDADRTLVILDQVDAVYLITPMAPSLPAGIPTPPIVWRADWKQ